MTTTARSRAGSTATLRLAVVDGPDGTSTCRAPDERNAAIELQDRHGRRFWCSTVAGGCGGEVELTAGQLVRPYFRHRAGASACVLEQRPSLVERSYEHVRYQRVLLSWLADQGLRGQAERVLNGNDGRADLHVVVDDVSHSIEVQLSPLVGGAWAERDEKYRRSVDHVTWLYGDRAEKVAAQERVRRGVALLVEPEEDGDGLRVGVWGPSALAWSSLVDCRLNPGGVWTPHLDAARQEHEQRLRERDQAAQEEQERAERARGPVMAPALRRVQAPPLPAVAPADGWPGSMARWRNTFPEAGEWVSAQDWRWLDGAVDVDHSLVQEIAYLTQCIYFNGPTAMFDLPDAPEAEAALGLLQQAGLIQRSERSGVPRWQRCFRP